VAGPDALTIGLVAHYVFCPRRAWLEAVGETTDTEQVAVGLAEHAVTDDRARGRTRVDRRVDVVDQEHGYRGRCDTVERFDDGTVGIVEYKSTPVRRKAEVTEPTRIQVVLQAVALEAMGESVRQAVVYFVEHRQRVPVKLTATARGQALGLVELTRTCLAADVAPVPLEDDPKCAKCSHVSVCLPDERTLAPVRRRIVVSDPDSQVVHLATPGSLASIRSGRLIVSKNHEQVASIPVERVQGVAVHGNVDLTGGLVRELLWRDLSIVWCTSGGRIVGYASSTRSPNGAARSRQREAAHAGRLDLAREFVGAKITNQATLLRRNGDAPAVVVHLRHLAKRSGGAHSLEELLGLEGEAAHAYFASFPTMLKTDAVGLVSRARRPAEDPVGAALNYTYAILLGDCIKAVRACGLDPHEGFLHSSERNKPALALDLCEEFRAPVADSVVVRAFNNRELSRHDFLDRLGVASLTELGRKKLIAAYEQRVEGQFRHPTFGYQVTWRRAMEVQARLILGVLDGTQPLYLGVRTR
jgi:CRISPR-associated protein Cas1